MVPQVAHGRGAEARHRPWSTALQQEVEATLRRAACTSSSARWSKSCAPACAPARLAEVAEFFSFGTNDLTQATFSFSREDAENKFLPLYIETGILRDNPFEVLDVKGVGRLMKLAVEWGRGARPDLEDRHLRRARRAAGVDPLLPRRRPRLRLVLGAPRADRAARGGAGGAAGARSRHDAGAHASRRSVVRAPPPRDNDRLSANGRSRKGDSTMTDIMGLLGAEAGGLLQHVCKGIPRESLHLPGPDFVDRIVAPSDRSPAVMRSLQQLFDHGRLARDRLPVHPAGRPGDRAQRGRVVREESAVLRPREHRQARDRRRLQRGGLDARRARRVLAQVRAQDSVPAQVQPQRVPHLSQQVRPDLLRQHQAGEGPGRGGGGRDDLLRLARVRPPDRRGERRPSRPRTRWAWPRCCGAICATRRSRRDKDYHVSADLTGQANHLGVTIEADIIKQKLPENNGGYLALNTKENPYGKNDKRMYSRARDRPPDRPRALPGRELLPGPVRAHQFRRRVGRERPRRRGAHRGDQQARRRHGPHLRPQGVPEADGATA